MKMYFMAACISLFAAPAFAGTAMTVNNSSLGFSLTEYPSGPVAMDICDVKSNCFSFNYTKDISSDTILYTEVKGKCALTVQTFDKNFASGNTHNEFMLDLMAFVVKVTQGEDVCVLQQVNPDQKRSLTGVYL